MSKSLGNKYGFISVSMIIYDKKFMNYDWLWNRLMIIYVEIFKKLVPSFECFHWKLGSSFYEINIGFLKFLWEIIWKFLSNQHSL